MQLLELEPLIMQRLQEAFPADVLLVSSLQSQNARARNAPKAVTLVYGGMTVTDSARAANKVSERWLVALSVLDSGAQTEQTDHARSTLTQMIVTAIEALRRPLNQSLTLALLSSPPVQTSPGYQAYVLAFEARFTI